MVMEKLRLFFSSGIDTGKTKKYDNQTQQSPVSEAVSSPAPAKTQNQHILDSPNIPNTYTLTTGYYTAGVDIPAGKCNITAVSGSGNLYSSDCGISEIFGTERGNVSSLKGLILEKDIVLNVKGRLTVKIVYKSMDYGLSGDSYATSDTADISAENTYTLTTGYYTAGIDIPAGKCNITAVSGSGSLSSSDYEISEVFGTNPEDVSSFKGLKLPKDVVLNVKGRLTVKIDYKSIDCGASEGSYDTSGTTDTSTENTYTLTTGFYTAGIDIPAGKCDITAVSGTGSLSSSDYEISEVFGTDHDDVSSFTGLKLQKDIVLNVKGRLTVKVDYKSIDCDVSESSYDTSNAADTSTGNTYTLTTGFYTAGIDIPAGKCNITAVSGTGNLCSSDYEISEVFGTDHGDVASFKGLKLQKDIVLSVQGRLTVQIDYRSIDCSSSGRVNDMSGTTELSTGKYKVGRNFKDGTYNIVAVSGSGNIFLEDTDVNEVFGLDNDDIHEIKNVYFPKDAEFSIEDDLSVRLIPMVLK